MSPALYYQTVNGGGALWLVHCAEVKWGSGEGVERGKQRKLTDPCPLKLSVWGAVNRAEAIQNDLSTMGTQT
jgi:hypothetical protein